MPLRIYPSAQKGNSEKFASPRAVHRRFIAARYGIGRVGLFLEHPPLLSRVARWFPWACPFSCPSIHRSAWKGRLSFGRLGRPPCLGEYAGLCDNTGWRESWRQADAAQAFGVAHLVERFREAGHEQGGCAPAGDGP
jgi:hypothetical protein